jgi:hypothetical protein
MNAQPDAGKGPVELSPEQQSYYLQWLTGAVETLVQYHNHKENIAWTVTALAVAGSALFDPSAYSQSRLLTIVVVLATFAILNFVNMQFTMRWYSANAGDAIRRSLAAIAMGKTPVGGCEPVNLGIMGTYPRFVHPQFVKTQDESRRTWTKTVWEFLLLPLVWRWGTVDQRWRTEISSYWLILLSGLLLIHRIWSSPPPG